MLTRSQIKVPLYLLLGLSAVSFLAITAAIVLSALWKYIGFMMGTGTATICNSYLTFKVETLNTYVHNNVFYCACVSDMLTIVIGLLLLRLVVIFRGGQEENFPQFSRNIFYLLYILQSCAILLVIPGKGYFLTLIIEKGACLSTKKTEQIIIGMLYVLGLLLLLACWVILFFLYLKLDENEQKDQTAPPIIINEQPAESMKNYLEMFLLKQRMENMSTILQSRRPLLVEEVDVEDKASLEEGQKQKISFMNFQEYKEKQKLLREKQQEQQKQLAILMKDQYEKMALLKQKKEEQENLKKAMLKQKISSMALSPNHEDFDQIFQESQKDEPVQQITLNIDDKRLQQSHNQNSRQLNGNYFSQEEDPKMKDFYPANYVPADEQDEERFRKYKDKLLKRLNKTTTKVAPKRHLQNIGGGRSKKQLQKYINAFKRPKRDQEMYKRKYIEESPSHLESSVVRESQLTDNFSGKESATFNYHDSPKQQKLNSPKVVVKPLDIHNNQYSEQEEKEYQVITIRERTKSPMKKKLFQEETNYLQGLNSGSILGALVKRYIEPGHKRRLTQIKQERQIDAKGPKKRKNEKLIDFIRSRGS